MPYLVGVVLAAVVCGFATIAGFDRERAFYPVVTIVIATYYGLFAVMGGSMPALAQESVGIAAFLLVAFVGYKRNLWYVVAALAAHGVFDFVHGRVIADPGVPAWWPAFCLAYDGVTAAYLAVLLLRLRVAATARP
jgi:hypothetical protein